MEEEKEKKILEDVLKTISEDFPNWRIVVYKLEK